MPEIAELRRYAAIDPDDDAELLLICMDAAVDWLRNAGVPPPLVRNRLYDMAVYMLATHYHDRRGVVYEDSRGSVSKSSEQVPFGVFSIMHQLRGGDGEGG